jgi:predicted ATPase
VTEDFRVRLKKLVAKNFRLLEDFSLEFHPEVTLLIGPNNVGKSNVADALLFLRDGMGGHALSNLLQQRQGFGRVVSASNNRVSFFLKLSLLTRNQARQVTGWISLQGVSSVRPLRLDLIIMPWQCMELASRSLSVAF